jgi:hypothetical protein
MNQKPHNIYTALAAQLNTQAEKVTASQDKAARTIAFSPLFAAPYKSPAWQRMGAADK